MTDSYTALFDPTAADNYWVGTVDGVFVRTEPAVTWTEANSGLETSEARAVWVDPNDSTKLYAATAAGVFVSADGGTTWTPSNSGLTSLDAKTLAADAGATPVPDALRRDRLCRRLQEHRWRSLLDQLEHRARQQRRAGPGPRSGYVSHSLRGHRGRRLQVDEQRWRLERRQFRPGQHRRACRRCGSDDPGHALRSDGGRRLSISNRWHQFGAPATADCRSPTSALSRSIRSCRRRSTWEPTAPASSGRPTAGRAGCRPATASPIRSCSRS